MKTVQSGNLRPMRLLGKCAALGALAISVAGCVVPYPPPGPVAVAPAPQGAYYGAPYYAQPCCYSYSEYPPYYGPPVSLELGFGGGYGGYHRWR